VKWEKDNFLLLFPFSASFSFFLLLFAGPPDKLAEAPIFIYEF